MPAIVALAIAIADRITKIEIRNRVTNFDAIGVIPGWLRIVHTENPGAAFGVFNSTVSKDVGLGAQRQVQMSLRFNF